MKYEDIVDVGQRIGVGVAGTSYTLLGFPLSDWVAIATLIYLVMSAIAVAPRTWATIKRWLNKDVHDG
jgi:hypothetical protein